MKCPWLSTKGKPTGRRGKRHAACRDCGLRQTVRLKEFLNAARPRCTACGGQLDDLGRATSVKVGEDSVAYPAGHSEFEIQAHVYHTLRARGYDVRGEVVSRLGRSRFDLVVFDADRRPTRIIEVKKKARTDNNPRREDDAARRNLQLFTYESFRIPVDHVCGMDEAAAYCESFGVRQA